MLMLTAPVLVKAHQIISNAYCKIRYQNISVFLNSHTDIVFQLAYILQQHNSILEIQLWVFVLLWPQDFQWPGLATLEKDFWGHYGAEQRGSKAKNKFIFGQCSDIRSTAVREGKQV